MTKFSLWLAVSTLLAAAVALADGNSTEPKLDTSMLPDTARLQGTWRVLRLKVGKETIEVPGRSGKKGGVSLEMHGDHYEFTGMGQPLKGHFRVQTVGKDKRIEFTRDDGSVTLSSFQLQGESLKLTGLNPTGGAKAAANAEIWTFERENP